jgi:hypothetical protein
MDKITTDTTPPADMVEAAPISMHEKAELFIIEQGNQACCRVHLMVDFASKVAAESSKQQLAEVLSGVQEVRLKDGRLIFDATIVASPFEDGWTDGVTRWKTLEEALRAYIEGEK